MGKKEKLQIWKSLDDQQILVEVSVHDFMDHVSKANSDKVNMIIEEALSFAKNTGNWNFWSCCICNEKFGDSELHSQHMEKMHLKSLSPKCCALLPVQIDSEWEAMIVNGTWKPIDSYAAVAILKEHADFLFYGDTAAFGICETSIISASHSETTEESSATEFNVKSIDDLIAEEEDSRNRRTREYYLKQSLPLSDDVERLEMLINIRNILIGLLSDNCLSELHLDRVIKYSLKVLEPLFPRLNFWLLGLHQTHMCICFLDVPQLQKIIDFLKDISQFPSKNIHVKENNLDPLHITGFKNKERIVLSGDLLGIYLDMHSLGEKDISEKSHHNGFHGKGSLHIDALLKWTFSVVSSEEQLESWMHLRKNRKHHGKELLQTRERILGIVENMLEIKCIWLSYIKAFKILQGHYFGELWKRNSDSKYVPQSYGTILQSFQETFKSIHPLELAAKDFDQGADLMLEAASDILDEAQLVNNQQEQTLIGFTTSVSELEFCDFSDERRHDDNCIEEAVKRLSVNTELELVKIDAWTMQALGEMQNLDLKINLVSADDYLTFLLPLVKSYMLENLEDLAQKDFMRRPEATQKYFFITI